MRLRSHWVSCHTGTTSEELRTRGGEHHQKQGLMHSGPQELLQPCPKDRAFLVPNQNIPFRNHVGKVLFERMP